MIMSSTRDQQKIPVPTAKKHITPQKFKNVTSKINCWRDKPDSNRILSKIQKEKDLTPRKEKYSLLRTESSTRI